MTASAPAVVAACKRFRAMGVDVELLTAADEQTALEAFSAAEWEFERLTSIFSRFDPGSELSRLNRDGGGEASAELLDLAEAALAARTRTGGLVDVTVHDALVAWGYDRTFVDVRDRSSAPEPVRCGRNFSVDRARGRIDLSPGTRLDFGGLAKGYAVDVALARLAVLGPAIVNAGGDLAVRADPTSPWPVGVDTPSGGMTLSLAGGALATSGRDARRWRAGGRDAHHLIDPRTGAPSTSDLLRATAWAPSGLDAEVAAKTLFLLGSSAAAAYAERERVPCVLVTAAGDTVTAGGLA